MIFKGLVYSMPQGSDPVLRSVSMDNGFITTTPPVHGHPYIIVFNIKDINIFKDSFRLLEQHSGKGLASILINRKRDTDKNRPFILQGKYQNAGVLQNAINKFFVHAAKANEKKPYLITINEGLFNRLTNVLPSPLPYAIPHHPEIIDRYEELAKHCIELKKRENVLRDDKHILDKYRGTSYSCQLVRQMILTAAESDYQVIIEGEPGTGKELVARAIHELRNKGKEKPFVAINCSAISPALLEAELFGTIKDYPNKGMPAKKGLWEAAEDGTLFLDEIGDLASDHQTKILRAIQEKKILKVGGIKEIHVNARVIAATNRDLEERDKYGKPLFRPDLYSRFKEIIIRTPTMRSHTQDIPEVAEKFWQKLSGNKNEKLPDEVKEILKAQEWKENVRGLENALKTLINSYGPNPTAETLETVLTYINFNKKPNITIDKLSTPDLADIIEMLAKASHKTWFDKRKKEGYVWGEKRIDDGKIKTNPDLRPFDELTEKQKSYSLAEARSIVKAILDQGYFITK
jgi:DNA-binding NtrC family response regulator